MIKKTKYFPFLHPLHFRDLHPRPKHPPAPFFYFLFNATHPPYPCMGNWKGHEGTTAVQQGGGTQGAVKHRVDCLSEKTKVRVSLRGIPLPPLAPCVYNRFVWLEKVMWVKREKKKEKRSVREKKTSAWNDCMCTWECVSVSKVVYVFECVLSVK